jgi:ribosomal protein S18 acetylase RimI-like enzyme
MFSQCEWLTREDGLVLVFRGLEPPLIFPFGAGPQLVDLLGSVRDDRVWVNYTVDQEPAFRSVFEMSGEHPYVRMTMAAFQPRTGPTVVLGPENLPELNRLYQGGAAPIFSPSQLETGYFRGIYAGGRLVSAAGVHVLSAKYGVATVGNVVTDAAFRGQGYAAACTSAVVESLFDNGFRTIALNVERDNRPALRVYERLGFRTHCLFTDARARRR